LQMTADSLRYSYESFSSTRIDGNAQPLILQLKNGGSLVRNISMSTADGMRFNEILAANAAYRAAALAMPKDEEIYRIDAGSYAYENKSDEAAALESLFALYREDRSKLSYEDLPPTYKTVTVAAPAAKEDMKHILYKGDTVLDFSLRAEGMHNGRVFSDNYSLTQKTPNAANAAMRFCNNREQEMMREIQATIESNVSFDWISIGLQLCNIPSSQGTLNSEYISFRSMKDYEKNAENYEKDLNVLTIEQTRTLLRTLFSGNYASPDIHKPFVQFSVNVDYVKDDGNYTSQAVNTIYVTLDEKSMQTILAMFPVQSPEEAALQNAVS